MKIQKIALMFLAISLTSCVGDVSSRRLPKAINDQEQLKNSPVQKLEKKLLGMNSEARASLLPKAGEVISYSVTYSIAKSIEFEKVEGGTSFTCSFTFEKSQILESIKKVEGNAYEIEKIIIPTKATFTGAPISDWEKKCRKDLSDGQFKRSYNLLINEQVKLFKAFVRLNFIKKYNNCLLKVRPNYYTCQSKNITIKDKNSELVDYTEMIFAGLNKGKDIKINASINFEKVYFTSYGLLYLELIGTDSINFSGIKALEMIDWKF